ncbi:sporulation-delaying protein SdpB family protein [Leifsonia sp. NPDC056665]|uniref:sporulation-delaying protein SdpB family protein n=1 Tax=Leifsonia sp. NPDC056665 TaxID=3345901 RepID=UPI00368666BF
MTISPIIGLGRSLLALAQATVFVFSDVRAFLVPVGGKSIQDSCGEYLGRISLFCIGPSPDGAAVVEVIALLIVASGVLPRYTCILHAYMSVSFIGVLALPDGGDLIATSLSFLLVFVYIGDPRLWHWGRGESTSAVFRGISKGAQFAIRVQVAFIYFQSATSKFAVDTWADGSQMYYVTREEMFGASGPLGDVARALTSVPLVTLASSWGAIAMELSIVVLIFIPKPAAAKVAITLAIALHVMIIALIGIGSFGLVMIGAVLCASGSRIARLGELVHPRFPRRLLARFGDPDAPALSADGP